MNIACIITENFLLSCGHFGTTFKPRRCNQLFFAVLLIIRVFSLFPVLTVVMLTVSISIFGRNLMLLLVAVAVVKRRPLYIPAPRLTPLGLSVFLKLLSQLVGDVDNTAEAILKHESRRHS